jgi:hypothetical protein
LLQCSIFLSHRHYVISVNDSVVKYLSLSLSLSLSHTHTHTHTHMTVIFYTLCITYWLWQYQCWIKI